MARLVAESVQKICPNGVNSFGLPEEGGRLHDPGENVSPQYFFAFLISPLYAISAPQAGGQSAGSITALIRLPHVTTSQPN